MKLTLRLLLVAACLLLGRPAPNRVPEPVLRIGVIGDSLSDEYGEEVYAYAKGWTEILARSRSVSFGPEARTRDVPRGNWGEPRRTMFEDNWARATATSADALAEGQHTGVAAAVREGRVSHVVIFIGTNDYSPFHYRAYNSVYAGEWADADEQRFIESMVANQVRLIEEVRAAGARVVVAAIPDFAMMPIIVDAGWRDGARRARADAMLQHANARIREEALARGIPFVDLHAPMRDVFGPHESPAREFRLAGIPIRLRERDTPLGNDPCTGWIHDGIHPQTWLQAIWANIIVTALNEAHGTSIPPLSEEEIADIARLGPFERPTLHERLRPWRAYVSIPGRR